MNLYKDKGIILTFIKRLVSFSEHVYIFFILGCASITLLTGIIANFKILFLLFTLVWILIWLRLKNFLISSFLVTVYSLPFFTPNKYYIQEIIRGSDMLIPLYKGGYYLGYGLNITNIFVIISSVFLLKEIIQKRIFLNNFQKRIILLIVFCAAGFFFIGFISSLSYSPFTALSITWLFQYEQMFILTILMFLIYYYDIKRFLLFYDVIFISSVFQFILSMLQFLKQSPVGISIEQYQGPAWFGTGLDEINGIYRIFGSFTYHNQLALYMLIFLVLLLPSIIKSNRVWKIIVAYTSIITIILTQSRSIWIAFCVNGLIAIRLLQKQFHYFLLHIPWQKLIIYLFIVVVCVSYVIIPRVLLSFNAFYEGAGIPFRIRIFSEAIQSFLINPWFGYGIGTNEYVMSTQNNESIIFMFPTSVHMGFLQLTLEVGLIGLAFFLIPYLYICSRLLKIKSALISNDNLSEYKFRFISGLVVFTIYYLFLAHIGIIEFALLGIILGCGCIALSLSHEKKSVNLHI